MWQFAVFGGRQKGTLLKLVIPFFAEQALFVWGRQSFNFSSRLPIPTESDHHHQFGRLDLSGQAQFCWPPRAMRRAMDS